jgi:hypothetical protein
MRIIYRPGVSGAWGPTSGEPHVRFTAEVEDHADPANVRIVIPNREDAPLLAGLFAYAAGLPDFSVGEWRLIASAVGAYHADNLKHITTAIEQSIERAYGR